MSPGDLELTKSTQAATFFLRLNVTTHWMMNGKTWEICLFREDTTSPQLLKVRTHSDVSLLSIRLCVWGAEPLRERLIAMRNSKASPSKCKDPWVAQLSVNRTSHPSESFKKRRGQYLGSKFQLQRLLRVQKYSPSGCRFPCTDWLPAVWLSSSVYPLEKYYFINVWNPVSSHQSELDWTWE